MANHLRISVIGFCNRGICLGVLAVPDPPHLLYFFNVDNVMICSKVFFSYSLCCRETSQLNSVGWSLYDRGWLLEDVTEQTLAEILTNL